MILTHHKWEKSGRTFKTENPGQFCYTSMLGEEQTWDGLKWLPYLWKATGNELRYGHDVNAVEFALDKQILKKAGQVLVSSSKFFVQKETSPGVWENQPHGLPTKNIAQDYPEEGRCTGYLDFPDAPYDLKIGLEIGRSARAIFGFKFRAAISGRVRFVWVNDGIEKLPANWEWIWARFASFKGKEDRKVGIKFKDIEWRWGYDEAPFRNIQVETNPDDTKKLNIVFGPYDYTANEWLEVYPDTFGPSQIVNGNNDCDEWNRETTQITGYDSDGDPVGLRAVGQLHDIGWRFPGVTVPNAATIDNGSHVSCFQKYIWGGGVPTVLIKGIDEDNTGDWTGNRISQRSPTTASAAWTPTNNDETWQNTSEIKTIVKEIVDRGGWSSGNAMAIVALDNGSAATEAIQFQDYDRESAYAAKLTIVYTTAAGVAPTGALYGPLVGPIGGPV